MGVRLAVGVVPHADEAARLALLHQLSVRDSVGTLVDESDAENG